jgi:hypothetical protein
VINNISNNEQENLALQTTHVQKTIMSKNLSKLRNVFAVGGVFIATSFLASHVNALEIAGNFHKGQESTSKGYSFALADTFTKGSNLYWTVAYSSLDDVKVEWNNDELFFKIDTIDALLSYRHKIQSYNSFFKNLTIEYQVGASAALTENKFTWPETPGLEEEVRYFSEKIDINAVIGVGAYYKLDRNTSINFGVKYQPSFSEFGAVTSAYIGLSYRFGRGLDY